MSKQNNLKDYLTDLYQGIASKKPGASRNPQDFRAEIEAIETGGNITVVEVPEWDGYITKSDTESGELIPTEGLAYTLSSDGTYYNVSGMGTATDTSIVIASTYNGLPVRGFTQGAFYDESITMATLGSNMTSVGYQAFDYCKSLRKVVINDGVQYISKSAFGDCSNLTDIVLPDSVTTIYNFAFARCTGLKSITIPNGVVLIEYNAFDGCTSLTDVYYKGTETEWNNKVEIGTNNDPLLNATIHYNS